MQCYNHPTHMATAICSICGNGICPQCQGTQAGQVTCPNCQAGLKPAAGPLVPSYIDGPGGTDEFATMMLPRARGSLIAGGIGGIMLTLAAVLHMIPMRSGAMLIMVMIFALMGLCLMGSGFFGFRTVFNSSLAGATGGLLYAAASISVLVLLAALSKSRSFFFLTTILLYIIQLICYIVMTVTLFKHKNEGVGGRALPAGGHPQADRHGGPGAGLHHRHRHRLERLLCRLPFQRAQGLPDRHRPGRPGRQCPPHGDHVPPLRRRRAPDATLLSQARQALKTGACAPGRPLPLRLYRGEAGPYPSTSMSRCAASPAFR